MTTDYVIEIHRYDEQIVEGKRLGRHVRHDSRSRAYLVPPLPAGAAWTSVTWPRMVPIFDQGAVGSCTGNAMVGYLGTMPDFGDLPAGHPALDEAEALRIYSAAEVIDGDGPYPPNDYGSCGLSVAKAAKNAGLITGYVNAFSLNDALNALQSGPVITGIDWYDSFDSPGSDGLVTITPGAQIRGGHEVLVRGCDVPGKLIHLDNSWGASWGLNGSFTMSWATWDQLLSEYGDVTAPVPLAQPAPTPAPPGPSADQVFAAVLGTANARGQAWVDQRHSGYVTTVARAGRAWLNAKGL